MLFLCHAMVISLPGECNNSKTKTRFLLIEKRRADEMFR